MIRIRSIQEGLMYHRWNYPKWSKNRLINAVTKYELEVHEPSACERIEMKDYVRQIYMLIHEAGQLKLENLKRREGEA